MNVIDNEIEVKKSIDGEYWFFSDETISYFNSNENLTSALESLNILKEGSYFSENIFLKNSGLVTEYELSRFVGVLDANAKLLQETYVINNQKLIDAISSIPEGSYGLEIISAIVGAFVAAVAVFVFNIIYFSKINNKNKKSHYSNVALKLLEYFECSATMYWISDKIKNNGGRNKNENEMKLLEIRIKSDFKVLRTSLNSFCSSLEKSESSDFSMINKYINELFDLATGGDFESNTKSSDVKITHDISILIARLKSILIKYSQQVS